MVQKKTLDDFKGKEIPYYYKASKKKTIPLSVQHEMLREHLKSHLFYKIFAFVVVIYSFFYFFKYLKLSKFLEISRKNFAFEKKEFIKKTILENDRWILDLLQKQSDYLKDLKLKEDLAAHLENLKLLRSKRSWYDFFFTYNADNPDVTSWKRDYFLIFFKPQDGLKKAIYDFVYYFDPIYTYTIDPFMTKKNWVENRFTEWLGWYTPPVEKKILTEAEIQAQILFKIKQETFFSNYNCEIRSSLIEYLFKNKVTLDFLEYRRSFVPINWIKFENNFLNFQISKDFFFNGSLGLEKDPIFFLYLIFKDIFISNFYLFNLFFYFVFILFAFFLPVFFFLFLIFLKNFKFFFYNFCYYTLFFFKIIEDFIFPYWRNFKKFLLSKFLKWENNYFYPFEKKTRSFFKIIKNNYEKNLKHPFLKYLHNFANKLEDTFGIKKYEWAQKLKIDEQYGFMIWVLWHIQGITLEFIWVTWLYHMPVNIIITDYRLARFLFWWPESFLTTGIERLTLILIPVAYFKCYWYYRWVRADQTIFVLETKQNYFQAQAIDAEEEWVFFHLHDYDKIEGIYERYYRVCDGNESRIEVGINHFSHDRNYEIYVSRNPFFKFFKWKFWWW